MDLLLVRNDVFGELFASGGKVTNCGYLSTLALITIRNVKMVSTFLSFREKFWNHTLVEIASTEKSIWFSYKFFCWNSSVRIKSVSSFKLLLRDSLREIGKEAQTPKANFITMRKYFYKIGSSRQSTSLFSEMCIFQGSGAINVKVKAGTRFQRFVYWHNGRLATWWGSLCPSLTSPPSTAWS